MNPIQDDRGEAVKVAEAVQNFITAMDGVKLGQRAVDEIQPLISEIVTRSVQGHWMVLLDDGPDNKADVVFLQHKPITRVTT